MPRRQRGRPPQKKKSAMKASARSSTKKESAAAASSQCAPSCSQTVKTEAPDSKVQLKQTPLRVKPPKSLLKQMESTGVELESIKGEGQVVLRLSGVASPAWELHREWACTRAKPPPQVDFFFAPVATHYKTAIATPMKLVGRIQVEIESLLSYIEPLRMTDFVNGEPPVLPAPLPEQDSDDDPSSFETRASR